VSNGLKVGLRQARTPEGLFYGLRNFCCKTAQVCATRREYEMAETPSVSNGAQRSENKRKNSFLNYDFLL